MLGFTLNGRYRADCITHTILLLTVYLLKKSEKLTEKRILTTGCHVSLQFSDYSNIYPTRCNVTQFIYIWKLLYMFRVVPPPIIRSANNCIYSIWYLSHRYCYLPISWKIWNWFECAVGGVRQIPDAVDIVVCAPDDGW